jgi:hypothetical protein
VCSGYCPWGVPVSRRSPREELQGLMDRRHGVHVEPLFLTRRDDVEAEHEVPAIGLGNDHPLRARQAERLTCVEEPFDLFGDGADGLDMPDLVDGPRHGQILAQRDVREGAQQATHLGAGRGVAIDAPVALLERNGGREGQRVGRAEEEA